jgi:hypothetical protein
MMVPRCRGLEALMFQPEGTDVTNLAKIRLMAIALESLATQTYIGGRDQESRRQLLATMTETLHKAYEHLAGIRGQGVSQVMLQQGDCPPGFCWDGARCVECTDVGTIFRIHPA